MSTIGVNIYSLELGEIRSKLCVSILWSPQWLNPTVKAFEAIYAFHSLCNTLFFLFCLQIPDKRTSINVHDWLGCSRTTDELCEGFAPLYRNKTNFKLKL